MPPVRLTPELRRLRGRWVAAASAERERIYAEEIAPVLIPRFRRLALEGAPPGFRRPRNLISILGRSWQPVALMAAWCRPRSLILIGTAESLKPTSWGADPVGLVARLSGVERRAVIVETIVAAESLDLYRMVRRYVESASSTTALDLTGGKKWMSVLAGLAGYLTCLPLLYVDHLENEESGRIPLPGSEYPRWVPDPLEVFGDLRLAAARQAFNRGDFEGALDIALELQSRLISPREAETVGALSVAYREWSRFEFGPALRHLGRAAELLKDFGRRWSWAADCRRRLSGHLHALRELTEIARTGGTPRTLEGGLPLVVNHLAASQRTLTLGRFSESLLLTYAAVERYITLRLATEHGVSINAPSIDRIVGFDEERFHEIGRLLWEGKYQAEAPSSRPLNYTRSLQLLMTLDPIAVPDNHVRPLMNLANTRNHTEFEHGFLPVPPDGKTVLAALDVAIKLVVRVRSTLRERLKQYEFPQLAMAEKAHKATRKGLRLKQFERRQPGRL